MNANPPAQPELDLSPNRVGSDPLVEAFVAALEKQSGWLKAAELLPLLRLVVTESNKRHIREWANASGGRILSGQQGYLHIKHATAEDVRHAANWLEHQAKEMGDRARAIRARYHQQLHEPKI